MLITTISYSLGTRPLIVSFTLNHLIIIGEKLNYKHHSIFCFRKEIINDSTNQKQLGYIHPTIKKTEQMHYVVEAKVPMY